MTDVTQSPFRLVRNHHIDSLNLQIEEYEHLATGATHIHLAADNDENVFMVALRTVPHDSTGVAHILEHTALCGSEKYPVRDPFFMMIRRSLNTFMNAMTSSDWTAYPFASQNRKDFDNLLNVYLDAVFFSRLDPLDFAQEGHRLEFAEPSNPDSELVYKGVVFNEMKGAMSSVSSQLWQTLCKYLFPTTTYHYNSGGDPDCITDLSYQQLQAFYRTHYHPSNAIFMTFGDIPAADHQEKFQALALNRFEKLDEHIFVPEEKRYYAPLRVEEAYPYTDQDADNDAPVQEKTHIVMGWLLGKSTDLQSALEAQLLASVLLDNSASPLLHVLETTDLGSSPSPLCGLDDSQYEMSFVCGIEGSEPERAGALEQLVLSTLQQVAEEGIPSEDVEASLHQLELEQREITGDGLPYGLHLILTALGAATHRGDPIGLLDLEPVLAKLRQAIKDPDYLKGLVQRLLLNNQHRVRLTLVPDSQLTARKAAAEKAQLAAIKAELADEAKQAIVERAAALQQRQNQQDDFSILPKVGIEDVPANIYCPTPTLSGSGAFPVTLYQAGTNGLSYQQLVLDLPDLNNEELALLPLYTTCLTELGMGELDYLAAQKRQSQLVGSLSAMISLRADVAQLTQSRGHLVLSAKALNSNHQAMTQLMGETLHRVRFDEVGRIRELIAQIRSRREQSVTGNGHALAMAAASAGLNPTAQIQHQLSGLAGIQQIKALDKDLKTDTALDAFAQRLATLHQKILQQPGQFLLISDHVEQQHQALRETWQPFGLADAATLNGGQVELPGVAQNQVKQAWLTGTQVNFCAKAYPTVPMTHPDAAPLTVLAGVLRNGYLHRAIREQGGAYGGGAQQDSNNGGFRFFSYRDPRLTETLTDFDQAIGWLLDQEQPWQVIEESILGVVSAMDKPGSPAGEAKQAFHAELNGRTLERRETFRKQVLAVREDDLKRVANTYLTDPNQASVAVVTSPDNQSAMESLGLTCVKL